MPQKNRNVNDIINNAFYMLGEFSPNKIPESRDVAQGLYLLNDMLDYFSSKGVLIPFFTESVFTMTPGKGSYTFSKTINNADVDSERIVELDFVNIINEGVSYEVRVLPISQFKKITLLQDLQSWPSACYLQREPLKSVITFHPKPQLSFECRVTGKYMLDHLELTDQIDEIPAYYFRFLRYALARELKEFYPSSHWSEASENEFKTMYKSMAAATDLDVSLEPSRILSDQYGYDSSLYSTRGGFL